jgi:hypothetical protein
VGFGDRLPGFNGLDPNEDTERIEPCRHVERIRPGFNGLDPNEDTERLVGCWSFGHCQVSFNGLDPNEDTESCWRTCGRADDWRRSFNGLDPNEDTESQIGMSHDGTLFGFNGLDPNEDTESWNLSHNGTLFYAVSMGSIRTRILKEAVVRTTRTVVTNDPHTRGGGPPQT